MKALLFSYGSNNPAQLAKRLEHKVETIGAYLPGYVRVFRGFSRRWNGGVASVERKARGVVYGLVARVTADDLALMDQYEGIASGSYKRKNVTVTLGDGSKHKAVVYVAASRTRTAPSREYLKAVAKTISAHWKCGSGSRVKPSDIEIR